MRVTLHIDVPSKERLQELLQTVRDFENKDFPHTIVRADITALELTVSELLEIFQRIKPPYAYGAVLQGRDGIRKGRG